MTDAAKQARREYYRRWRERNRDKIREQAARYWERKAQQVEGKHNADI